MPEVVKRTERGWGGHFIAASRCSFRRNTLLEYFDVKIVVSTVGGFVCKDTNDKLFIEQIGHNRYYETMAFYSDPKDARYHDADVQRPIDFNSKWGIDHIDADDEANDMHEAVVAELTTKLLAGEVEHG